MVRLSGQDTCRGTFSSRHAVVVDIENGDEYMPLAQMSPDQADCRIYDSALSEAAVLGFEFGLLARLPRRAHRLGGAVRRLRQRRAGDHRSVHQLLRGQVAPHLGADAAPAARLRGQGPEHSSARPERFLQLCAEDNMQVVYPTTPAQYYHLLRRQVHRRWRKPLIVLTPKSLLRLPAATSPIEALTTGRFQRVLGDDAAPPADSVERVFVCTGKVFYDLAEERKRRGDGKTAIVRIEQLYPWRDEDLTAALAPYRAARELVWVQEEPSNMGALFFVEPRLRAHAPRMAFRHVARAESASPATGSHKAHILEAQGPPRRGIQVVRAPLSKKGAWIWWFPRSESPSPSASSRSG
jgi:2-oxoglutarate dehydrogenase E1 component